MQDPHLDELIWGTAATSSAMSFMHIDNEGFATSVMLTSSCKYWVVYQQLRTLPPGDSRGDMGKITGPGQGWEEHSTKGRFEAEAVLLRSGMVL